MKQYPLEVGNTKYLKEQSKVRFRNEWFTFWRHFCKNNDSGEVFVTTEQDTLNENQVYNQYREKHHVPFPNEIKQIRSQYGLSAAKMADILDFGINSYRQYEHGCMPSLAHAKLIRLAKDPDTFEKFVEEKRKIFTKKIYKKLCEQISLLKQQLHKQQSISRIWNPDDGATEYNGFIKPNLTKVAHCILFLVSQAKPLKTRLNKLLFYCDFLNYKRTGFSITGCNYRAIQLGPVPSHYHELFGLLETLGYIRIEEEMYDHGGTGERFFPLHSFDISLFDDRELQTMKDVVERFDEVRTRKIIEISHSEKGWIENKDYRDLISYQAYAFDLQGV